MTFVCDKPVVGLDEYFLYNMLSKMWSGTLLVSLELVVALTYHTAVLVSGMPDLGAEETAEVTTY